MTLDRRTPSRGDWASIIKLASRHYTIDTAIEAAIAELYGPGIVLHGRSDWLRFAAPDKRKDNRAGYCRALSHETAVVGRWDIGERHLIILADENDDTSEATRRQRIEQARQAADKARRERQQAQARKHAQTARQARQWWRDASPAERRHPYLLTKRVQPHNLRQQGEMLLVPLYADGVLVNLQRIHADGAKRFLPGGRITGAASLIGSLAGATTVYLCEGWATGATIHETSGCPVVVSMSCDNLHPVAQSLRNALPDDVAITVAADNDHRTAGNPGLTAGRQAALSIGASLTWPRFPCDGCACSDFNDLAACERGEVSA